MQETSNIIIIDDNKDFAMNLSDILKENGYEVSYVLDGKSVLSLCKKSDFDLAILDIKLPDIDGLDLIEKLSGISKDMEYIIITAYGSVESAVDAIKQRKIVDYEMKPLDMERFLTIIKQVTRRQLAEKTSKQIGEILLKRTKELTFLYKVGKQLRQTLDLDKIFNFMYKDISKIMRCDSIVLSYYESDTNLIQCMFAMDNEKVLDTSNFPSVSLNRESGRTQSKVILSKAPSLIKDYQAYVKSSRKSYYINNSGALQKEQDKSKDANLIRSALIVPLIMNEEVVGVVQVFSYKVNSYTENDLKMLNALAVQIAVAVNNALLYKRAQDEISERKRIEGKVVRYLKELERSNKELEQFAYVASHDLQEPLRMVSSFTQLLKERYRDKLDESGNEFIAYTIDGAKRMQRMIDDLLSYSRVTTRGKKFETVDFNSAFYQAIDNLQLLIEENNVKITKDKLPTMDADESQIIRLFQNLLDNAIKFKNERTPVINIRTKKRSEEFIISINDNGVGIDPEYKNSVFQVFKRLNGKNKYSGTGIGLAICKRIVERHGGKIWLDSTLREGSTFYFSIPKKSKT